MRLQIPFPSVKPEVIIQSRHPDYVKYVQDWLKWRLTYEGGREFIESYLRKRSKREGDTDFELRKEIAYVPRFAAAAVDDIKNSIFQRTTDVARKGGPTSYQRAIQGLGDGVDLRGSSMAAYIGTEILPELLTMKRVGVVTDNHSDLGHTMADVGSKTPYLCKFCAEDILSWYPTRPVHGFERLLLREWVDTKDDFGLPYETTERYRLYSKTGEGVAVFFLDSKGEVTGSQLLPLTRIPFTLFELPRSLLQDVADYQISLMNLESSDVSFAMNANFPFYYEFKDFKADPKFFKPSGTPGAQGTEGESEQSRDAEVVTGTLHGRQFPIGADAPGFIAPDPGTLTVSMAKGQQMREDIRLLVNLALTNMNPRRQSADSKAMDQGGLENGLAFIGLVLQQGENDIAKRWREFDKSGDETIITYPTTYNIESEEERFIKAEKLDVIKGKIPSNTFKRIVAKRIAALVVGRHVTSEELTTINQEIQTTESLISDPDVILKAKEQGLVGSITASNAIGFDGETEIPIAKEEHVERLAEIAKAQSENSGAARGLPDTQAGQPTGSDEKKGKAKRGEGK